jgi:gluconolactonase
MSPTIEVIAGGLEFPEGPAFDLEGDLWCVELEGGCLTRWSEDGLERYPADGMPNGLAFDGAGRAWVCDAGQNAVRTFEPGTENWQTVADAIRGHPLSAPNDLAFDSAGSLVFTCPRGSERRSVGYACCLRPEGVLFEIASRMRFPNGLAFVDGGKALIVAETHCQRLWKGGWDAEKLRWIGPSPWAEVGGPVGPDGMALGADGMLYVAVFGSGQVKAVDGNGEISMIFDLPGSNPTNIAFDPTGRLGLVVTEAERGELLSLPELGTGARLFDGG